MYSSNSSGLMNTFTTLKCISFNLFHLFPKKPSKSDLFINVFGWNKIPAPESDETPIPVFGLPVDIFKIYSVVNIAFSPTILEKYGKSSGKAYETELLINLAFNYIEDQNKSILIDKTNHEILENVTCKGDVNKCIEKLTSKSSEASVKPNMSDLDMAKEALNSLNSNSDGSKLPDSVLNKLIGMDLNREAEPKKKLVEDLEVKTPEISQKPAPKLILEIPSYESRIVKNDEGKELFEVRISLPKMSSIGECDLNVEQSGLTLNTNKEFYDELKVSFDDLRTTHAVDVDKAEAKFIKKSYILKIKIPLTSK